MLTKVNIDGYMRGELSGAGLEKLSAAGVGLLVPGSRPKGVDRDDAVRHSYNRIAIGDASSPEEAVARVRAALGSEADSFRIHVAGPGSELTGVLRPAG